MSKRVSVSLLAVGVIAASVAVTAPADAAPTRRCNDRQACFYYNSDQQGAVATIYNGGANLDAQIFAPNTGPGSRQKVEDHAASWDSRTRNTAFCVHRDRWWKGPFNSLKPQGRKNLSSALKNKNSSTNWYPRHEDGSGH
ncbi:hypothetical protein [Streptomyces sp. NPDC059010]|uniref:hypothetical protein n=1 Tax=Streptomyces sp. NPDC059010 TaxID=3346695 RepID=UPI003673DB9D